MAPDPDRLNDLAKAVLAAVVAGYQAGNEDLPTRRYVSAGPPAWDCEQLTVHVNRVFGHQGDVAAEQLQALMKHPGHTLRAAELVVTIARCQPAATKRGNTVVPPSMEQEEATARVVQRDVLLVLNSLVAAEKAGDLPGCNSIAFAGWNVVPASGGFVGGQQLLRVSLHRGP